MSFLKRTLKFLIFMGIILIPFNYFFAHFAFNRVLNNFVQSKVPKEQSLTFSSSFHFTPKPSVQIKNINYLDANDGHLQMDKLTVIFNLTELLKTKTFVVNDLIINNLKLSLLANAFDELLKSIVFSLIREGLGVPKETMLSLPPKFEIDNILLERNEGGDNAESFDIASMRYSAKDKKFMQVCFASKEKVGHFNQKFIAQYLIAATIEGNCLMFNKSLKRPMIPTSMTSNSSN